MANLSSSECFFVYKNIIELLVTLISSIRSIKFYFSIIGLYFSLVRRWIFNLVLSLQPKEVITAFVYHISLKAFLQAKCLLEHSMPLAYI